jgi:hypothetical protein
MGIQGYRFERKKYLVPKEQVFLHTFLIAWSCTYKNNKINKITSPLCISLRYGALPKEVT